jgi:hypothetical protein
MKSRILPVLFSLFVLMITACGNNVTGSSTEAPTVNDQASLMTALQASGAMVETGEAITQDFFTPEGNIIKVNGVDVQVFEYDSVEAMEGEASQVSSDGGSVGTSMVMWMEAPHFYKAGRILVLYVGSDQKILDLLEKVIAPQFAGR